MSKIILILFSIGLGLNAPAQSIQRIKVYGDTEANAVEVNTQKEFKITDTPNSGGADSLLALTTTAVEVKVGASAKVGRKYVLIEALSTNIKWGFTTDCNFSIKRNSFYIIPAGAGVTIYIKMLSGTGSAVIGEM